MKLELIALDDLVPFPGNPKDHDLGAIASMIRELGFHDPLIKDERTGFTLGGHGRTDALKWMRRAGERAPDGIEVRDATWLVHVNVTATRDDEHAKKLLIALNRGVELGGWDYEALTMMLSELADTAGLDASGFDEEDLEAMIRAAAGPPAPTSEDDGDKDPDRPGQVFTLGVAFPSSTARDELAEELQGRGFVVQVTT